MLVIRLIGALALIAIGGSLLAWIVTGNPRYRGWAWNAFRVGLVAVLLFFGLLALERIFVPQA